MECIFEHFDFFEVDNAWSGVRCVLRVVFLRNCNFQIFVCVGCVEETAGMMIILLCRCVKVSQGMKEI